MAARHELYIIVKSRCYCDPVNFTSLRMITKTFINVGS